ncbi:hypothetical protein LEP1GSC165_2249 [Leptospira santarosai str. CBC523]|nr:hypothetical protein LEP1GSC165_2249 [Leptospira santarosai str. CBC523]
MLIDRKTTISYGNLIFKIAIFLVEDGLLCDLRLLYKNFFFYPYAKHMLIGK